MPWVDLLKLIRSDHLVFQARTISQHSREIARRHLEVVAPAVIRPNQDWLQETYMVINAKEISEPGAARRAMRRLWNAAPPTSRQKPRPFPNRRVYRSLCQSDRICCGRTGC